MTDTKFDCLAKLTQKAVDMLKAAIERAEAAELQLSREAMQVAELMLEVRTLRKQRDEFRDEVEQLNRELSKAWHHMYRTPGTKADRKPSWTRADIPYLLARVEELEAALTDFADAMESCHASDENYRQGYVNIARLAAARDGDKEAAR